jgi:hypothetical protein
MNFEQLIKNVTLTQIEKGSNSENFLLINDSKKDTPELLSCYMTNGEGIELGIVVYTVSKNTVMVRFTKIQDTPHVGLRDLAILVIKKLKELDKYKEASISITLGNYSFDNKDKFISENSFVCSLEVFVIAMPLVGDKFSQVFIVEQHAGPDKLKDWQHGKAPLRITSLPRINFHLDGNPEITLGGELGRNAMVFSKSFGFNLLDIEASSKELNEVVIPDLLKMTY